MIKRILIILIPAIFAVYCSSAQVAIEISQEKILENGQKFYLHTVQQGQTLYSICKAYSVTEKEVINSNPDLQSGSLSIGQVIRIPIENEISKDGKYIVYMVKKGETLYSLLKRFETSEKEFYAANPKLNKKSDIKAGDEIYFPIKGKKTENIAKPQTQKPDTTEIRDNNKYIYHTVAKGETLYKITKQYNISLDELVAENPSLADRPLSIDEIIRIPRKQNIAKPVVATPENNNENNEMPTNIAHAVANDTTPAATDDSTATRNYQPGECNPDEWYTHGKEFNVMLLMSFETSANIRDLANQEKRKLPQKIRPVTEKAVDFYSGCLVALENLKNEDVKINFKSYDIGKDNSVLTIMVANGKFSDVDLIIGPAYKSQVDYLNSLEMNIPMLLPFVTDENILKNNPYNIMLNPSKQDIRNEVSKYAAQISGNNVLIVKGTSDDSKLSSEKYMEAMKEAGATATEVVFNGSSIENLETSLKKDGKNIIIPTFENEMTTSRVLTQVFKLCEDYDITLVSDPKIMNYESIDPNYYLEVKYTYYSNINIDYKNIDVKTFVSKFHSAFLCEPNNDAYIAADAIGYFIPLLQKAGRDFTPCIDQEYIYDGLGGKRQYVNSTNYFENSFSNKEVYLYTIQKDFSFSTVYPIENPEEQTEEPKN